MIFQIPETSLKLNFVKIFSLFYSVFFKSEVVLTLQFHKYFQKCIDRFVLRFRDNKVLHLKYIEIGIIYVHTDKNSGLHLVHECNSYLPPKI